MSLHSYHGLKRVSSLDLLQTITAVSGHSSLPASLDPHVIRRLQHALTTQKFETRERSSKVRIQTVYGISEAGASQLQFLRRGQPISVAGYYQLEKGCELKYPDWPCVEVGSKSKSYHPLELCSFWLPEELPWHRVVSGVGFLVNQIRKPIEHKLKTMAKALRGWSWRVLPRLKWLRQRLSRQRRAQLQRAFDQPDLRYAKKFEELVSALQPSAVANKEVGDAINEIVRLIQEVPGWDVDRVVKTGSTGKGTSIKASNALGNGSDVDLVVFVNPPGGPPTELLLPSDQEGELLRAIIDILMANALVPSTQTRHHIGCVHKEVDFDILVSMNNCFPRYCEDRGLQQEEELIEGVRRKLEDCVRDGSQVEDISDRQRIRALAERSTAYVKSCNPKIKGVVRLTKAWVKGLVGQQQQQQQQAIMGQTMPRKRVLPTSFVLELLVIYAYQQLEATLGVSDAAEQPSLLIFIKTLEVIEMMMGEGAASPPVMMLKGAPYCKWWTPEMEGLVRNSCWGGMAPFIIHPIDPTYNCGRQQNLLLAEGAWNRLTASARELLGTIRTQDWGRLSQSSLAPVCRAYLDTAGGSRL